MIRALRKAYGAGYRAGMSPRALRRNADGTKNLVEPSNPYTGRLQFLSRLAWESGMHTGTMNQLNQWLKRRREGRAA